ncbi:type VI secretion system baseplate subunit TssF [Pseudomonas sp. NPDC090201]|uniref:type VI secretion system baseplate subunit TssF n=1 Tax=Pseudomonas sp. NPDC090201 TaxID=3364475 RepID=UPI003801A24F
MSKDNLTLEYFDAEMRYLREAAREFAQVFPDRAAMLNLNMPGPVEPQVEQLFQGFAFLMGRLREKLDDDLPELTEGLIGMVRPQYLRMIPSLSIVELAPEVNEMKACAKIARGFEVLSRPIGAQQTRCRYTTTQDLALRALALDIVEVSQALNGRWVIRLRFSRGKLLRWDQMDLANIPLYLNASAPVAYALHQALTLNAETVHVRKAEAERELLDVFFAVKGFADDDRLWPEGGRNDGSYQLLLEYFSFPERFMFVTLKGLEHMHIEPDAPWFELEVLLRQPWPRAFALGTENIRLHTVPVINLFPLEAEPITLDSLQSDYLLKAMGSKDNSIKVYSVDSVTAANSTTRHDYQPFKSFEHKGGTLPDGASQRYFHTRVRRGPSGSHDTWLILGGDGFEVDRSDPTKRLSLRLTGTNGQLPRMALTSSVLDTAARSSRVNVKVQNLCPPTLPCYPPAGDRFHWRVLSHLGSQFLSMLDSAEVLRNTLALYDWTGGELNKQRLKAITEVNHFLIQRFEKGFVLRGVDIEVALDTECFAGEGDVFLFGEMLSRFFAQYADIHLFNQLTLVVQPEGNCVRWRENHSERVPG